MKLASNCLILLNTLVVGAAVVAGESPIVTNTLVNTASISNYQRLAAQCNEIVARVAPPRDIESALHPFSYSFGSSGRWKPDQTDWPQNRLVTVSTILTNLARLEDGLRQADTITNIELKPPNRMYQLSMPWQTNEFNTDPEIAAARTAARAYNRLEDLRWDLEHIAAVRDRIIDVIAEAYARPPADDEELHRLLLPYTHYNFATECTNALNAKLQELKSGFNTGAFDPTTGLPIVTTNRLEAAPPR